MVKAISIKDESETDGFKLPVCGREQMKVDLRQEAGAILWYW